MRSDMLATKMALLQSGAVSRLDALAPDAGKPFSVITARTSQLRVLAILEALHASLDVIEASAGPKESPDEEEKPTRKPRTRSSKTKS